jgi:hypothetical protein
MIQFSNIPQSLGPDFDRPNVQRDMRHEGIHAHTTICCRLLSTEKSGCHKNPFN